MRINYKKITWLAAGATVASLATAEIASAHTTTIACNTKNGNYVDVTLTAFPPGPIDLIVNSNGIEVFRRQVTERIVTVEVPDDTQVTTQATGTDGLTFLAGFYKDCMAPVPPPITPLPPPVVVPQPLTPIEPLPRKATTPKKKAKPRKPKVTCRYLNRVGAGPKAYTARGWYYRCKPPRPVRTTPPVTG